MSGRNTNGVHHSLIHFAYLDQCPKAGTSNCPRSLTSDFDIVRIASLRTLTSWRIVISGLRNNRDRAKDWTKGIDLREILRMEKGHPA